MTGTITALRRDKGFGFIRDVEGRDRFFNIKDLVGIDIQTVPVGQAVKFDPIEVGQSDKNNGLRASNVELA